MFKGNPVYGKLHIFKLYGQWMFSYGLGITNDQYIKAKQFVERKNASESR